MFNNPTVIFDGAHNDNALDNFTDITNSLYKEENKTFIISIITTKDYKKMIEKLLKEFPTSTFIFTSGNNTKKFFNSNLLLDYANNLKQTLKLEYIKLQEDNLLNLKEIIKQKNNTYFILGSFYVYNIVNSILK